HHHAELVAAETADEVAPAHGGAQAPGGVAQQVVALGVAEGVVDRLEAVEVEHEHAEAMALCAGAGVRLLHQAAEGAPVVQAGQRVLERLPLDYALLLLERRDVDEGGQSPLLLRQEDLAAEHRLDRAVLAAD